MCTNKSNLLIALLRALKIPAGYGILNVKTAKFYGVFMCSFFKKIVSPETTHIYIGIFYNKKWIRCHPSVDDELAEAMKGKSIYSKISRFDIKNKEIKNFSGILKKRNFLQISVGYYLNLQDAQNM